MLTNLVYVTLSKLLGLSASVSPWTKWGTCSSWLVWGLNEVIPINAWNCTWHIVHTQWMLALTYLYALSSQLCTTAQNRSTACVFRSEINRRWCFEKISYHSHPKVRLGLQCLLTCQPHPDQIPSCPGLWRYCRVARPDGGGLWLCLPDASEYRPSDKSAPSPWSWRRRRPQRQLLTRTAAALSRNAQRCWKRHSD